MVKYCLLLVYLACDFGALSARLARLELWPDLVVFGLLYLGLSAGLLTLAWLRASALRLGLAAMLASAGFVQMAYQHATGQPLDYEPAVALYLSRTAGDAALAHFAGSIQAATGLALVLFLGLALPPGRRGLSLWQGLSLPLVSFGLLTALIYDRGGTGARGTPPGFALLSHAFLYGTQQGRPSGAFRHMPLPRPGAAVATGDVVLIVDESIGAHYLDLTRPTGVRSGLLSPLPSHYVTNYGHAAALSGCSVYSNYLLRFGGTQHNYTTAPFKWPSIWAYARQAGFRTVYLDGQAGGALQNMMQPSERAQIDDFVSINTRPIYTRDPQLADVIARYSRNGRRDFIYVNKAGAHFPILDKYPPQQARYTPEPAPSPAQNIWDGFSNPAGASWSADQWARYRNGYRNALAWTVGAFFDRLLAQLQGQSTLILYTSDHGLDLRERGGPGLATHCTPEARAMEQGIIPLVVIAPKRQQGLHWAKAHPQNYDRATAFRIFPTLLVLMGYDRAAVRAHYGRPLDEQPDDRFARIGRFNGLRDQRPDLVDMDVRRVVAPPVSDYLRPPKTSD